MCVSRSLTHHLSLSITICSLNVSELRQRQRKAKREGMAGVFASSCAFECTSFSLVKLDPRNRGYALLFHVQREWLHVLCLREELLLQLVCVVMYASVILVPHQISRHS